MNPALVGYIVGCVVGTGFGIAITKQWPYIVALFRPTVEEPHGYWFTDMMHKFYSGRAAERTCATFEVTPDSIRFDFVPLPK